MTQEIRKLSLPTMAAFGLGQSAEGVKNAAYNTFLLFYYQQVIGLSGTMTGLALAIALVFDAVTDPVAIPIRTPRSIAANFRSLHSFSIASPARIADSAWNSSSTGRLNVASVASPRNWVTTPLFPGVTVDTWSDC